MTSLKHTVKNAAAILFLGIAASHSFAPLKYGGCADEDGSNIRVTTVIGKSASLNPIMNDKSLHEPISFDFDSILEGGKMHVDIYFNERRGVIKHYDARKNTITKIGEFKVMMDDPTKENGMTGLALDPNFKTNRHIWLYYVTEKSINTFRLSRFTLKPDGMIDKTTEKRLFDIPINETSCCHSGGGLDFDAYGDLWVATGDQAYYACQDADPDPYKGAFLSDTDRKCSAEWGASSTASLLGAYLRVHPDDKDPRGYTVPKGNFGEYWAAEFRKQGKTELAEQYEDPKKVRPELYAKGLRNPYTLTVDPVRRWVVSGDCGPDGPWQDKTEEHNLITHPTFMGWPYFAGNQVKPYQKNEEQNPLKPVNDSPFNKDGVKDLPPAEPAIYNYVRQCAMVGAIYRYDSQLKSDYKLPPHFDGKWFITDFNKGWIKLLSLDKNGSRVTEEVEIYPGATAFKRPLLMKIGPDGALYVNDYAGYNSSSANTRIARLEYKGDCKPAGLKPDKAGCMDNTFVEYDREATHPWPEMCKTKSVGVNMDNPIHGILFKGFRLTVSDAGPHTLIIRDVNGRIIHRKKGSVPQTYVIPKPNSTGIHFVTVITPKGKITRRFVNY